MSTQEIYNYLQVNDRLLTGGQPTAEQLRSAAAENVRAVINLAPYSPRYSIEDEEALVRSLGMEYYHIPVEWEAPQERDFERFEKTLQALGDSKALIHCAANFRVTAFYSLYALKHLGWTMDEADAFRARIWNSGNFPVWEKFIAEMKSKIATSPEVPDKIKFPTPQHRSSAEQIVAFFSQQDNVDGVLLVNSCARGKATADSCLDIIVLVPESLRDPGYTSTVLERGENRGTDALYQAWEEAPQTLEMLNSLSAAGRFAEVHLDITDGVIRPSELSRDEALDSFELAIGNYFVYSQPLWLRGDRFYDLKSRWMPYYPDSLREERLAVTREFCLHYIDHIEPYVGRGLYFQAFDRLYQGFQGFLQGIFIARRVYPIAYNKWIHEQLVDILGLPELYGQLPSLFQIHDFESRELVQKGESLRALVVTYLVD